jgi:hypothetical protein
MASLYPSLVVLLNLSPFIFAAPLDSSSAWTSTTTSVSYVDYASMSDDPLASLAAALASSRTSSPVPTGNPGVAIFSFLDPVPTGNPGAAIGSLLTGPSIVITDTDTATATSVDSSPTMAPPSSSVSSGTAASSPSPSPPSDCSIYPQKVDDFCNSLSQQGVVQDIDSPPRPIPEQATVDKHLFSPFDFQFDLILDSSCHNSGDAVFLSSDEVISNCKENYKALFDCEKDLICEYFSLRSELQY